VWRIRLRLNLRISRHGFQALQGYESVENDAERVDNHLPIRAFIVHESVVVYVDANEVFYQQRFRGIHLGQPLSCKVLQIVSTVDLDIFIW
jgi:hypothetical protein